MLAPPQPIITAAQLGLQLQNARKGRRLSQDQLALRVGLSQSRLSELERTPGDLSVNQLLALCSQLGLQLTLQRRTEAPSSPTETNW